MDEGLNNNQLMCLWCRCIGHRTSKCLPEPRKDITRETLDVLASVNDDAPLCSRCCKLWPELVDLILTTKVTLTEDGFTTDAYNLGHIAQTDFLRGCPLCRLIFVSIGPMEPNGWDKHIVLDQSWSVQILGFDGFDIDTQGMQKYFEDHDSHLSHPITSYAGCLIAGPRRESIHGRFSTGTWPWVGGRFGQASFECITISAAGSPKQLAGKRVNPTVFDVEIVKAWISRCESLHITACVVTWQEEQRQMRFVNVHTLTIVQYPKKGRVDYIALTYVWGNSNQKRQRHRLGSVVLDAPKTIEDAISITKSLGKDFLWVDSLCIDQGDEIDKQEQLPLMAAIYGGAWATLVALEGDSADSGFPRALPPLDGKLDDRTFQWACTFDNKTLMTIPPTLGPQISISKWATRGWTLQEALLSPRCLYFTREQVHFECNILQACESLDDSNSGRHSSGESKFTRNKRDRGVSRGNFRSPFLDVKLLGILTDSDTREYGSKAYEKLVDVYTMRNLSFDTDALNAFSAILARLENMYLQAGFIWGIPRHDFKSFLLWSRRSALLQRRDPFPSWSWAGWKGHMQYYEPPLIGPQPYCQIHQIIDGQKVSAQTTPPDTHASMVDEYIFIPDESTSIRVKRCMETETAADLLPIEGNKTLLVVDGVIFKFILSNQTRHFLVSLDEAEAFGEGNPLISGKPYDCLLVGSRWYGQEYAYNKSHIFLILRWDDDGIAYRVGVLQLHYSWSPDLPPEFWVGCQTRLQNFLLG
ncbi:Heterokaryon incompatibility protein (HET) domain containing protein [Elaphomyces granulatus]